MQIVRFEPLKKNSQSFGYVRVGIFAYFMGRSDGFLSIIILRGFNNIGFYRFCCFVDIIRMLISVFLILLLVAILLHVFLY